MIFELLDHKATTSHVASSIYWKLRYQYLYLELWRHEVHLHSLQGHEPSLYGASHEQETISYYHGNVLYANKEFGDETKPEKFCKKDIAAHYVEGMVATPQFATAQVGCCIELNTMPQGFHTWLRRENLISCKNYLHNLAIHIDIDLEAAHINMRQYIEQLYERVVQDLHHARGRSTK